MEINEILSSRDLAKLLNISSNKLTRLTKEGAFRGFAWWEEDILKRFDNQMAEVTRRTTEALVAYGILS